MEFQFNVNEYFKRPIVEIGNTLLPPDFAGDRRALWNTVNKVAEIVNEMGEASANAQGLNKPITTAERLRQSDQNLYLLVDQDGNNGNGAVTGMLKVGRKGLYVFDREGQHYQVTPPCVLDFYVHEKRQRSGLGKTLFEYMLEKENLKPHNLAIDRPSEKFLNFLNKHYCLENPIKQMNNYVVFDGFFPESQKKEDAERSPMSRTNGLQSTHSPNNQPLYGRYGAPRPPCSMGQIIHNTTAQKNSEPTSPNNYGGSQEIAALQEGIKYDQNRVQSDVYHEQEFGRNQNAINNSQYMQQSDLNASNQEHDNSNSSQRQNFKNHQSQIRMFPEKEADNTKGQIWPRQNQPQQIYQMSQGSPWMPHEHSDSRTDRMPLMNHANQQKQIFNQDFNAQNECMHTPYQMQNTQSILQQHIPQQNITQHSYLQEHRLQEQTPHQQNASQHIQPNIYPPVRQEHVFQQPIPEEHSSRQHHTQQQIPKQRVPQQGIPQHIPHEHVMQKPIPEEHTSRQHFPQQGIPQHIPQERSFQQDRSQHVPQQYIPMQHVPSQQIPMQNVPQQGVPQHAFHGIIPQQEIPLHVPQQVIPQHIPLEHPQDRPQHDPQQHISMQHVPPQQIPMQNVPRQGILQHIPQEQCLQHDRSPHVSHEVILQQHIPGGHICELQTTENRPTQQHISQHQNLNSFVPPKNEFQHFNHANTNFSEQIAHNIRSNSTNPTNNSLQSTVSNPSATQYYGNAAPEQYPQCTNDHQTHRPQNYVPNIPEHHMNQRIQFSPVFTPQSSPCQHVRQEYIPHRQELQKSQSSRKSQERQMDNTSVLKSESVRSLLQVDPKYFKPDPVQFNRPAFDIRQSNTNRFKKEDTVASLINAEQEFFENGLLRDEYRVPSRKSDNNSQGHENFRNQAQTTSFAPPTQFVIQQHRQIPSSNFDPHITQPQHSYHVNHPTEEQTNQIHQERDKNLHDQRTTQELYVSPNPNSEGQTSHQPSKSDTSGQNQSYMSTPCQQTQNCDFNAPNSQHMTHTKQYVTQSQAFNHYEQPYISSQQSKPSQIISPGERQVCKDGDQGLNRNEVKSQHISPEPNMKNESEQSGNKVSELHTESSPATIRQGSYIPNDFVAHPDGQNTRIRTSDDGNVKRKKDISRQYGLNEIDMRRREYKSAIVKRPTDVQEIDTLEYGYPPQICKKRPPPRNILTMRGR